MRAIDAEVTARVVAELERSGFDDVSPAHHRLMADLPPEGARPSQLARMLGISRPAVGQLLERLEACGYVERVPDAADGRAQIVSPTDRARSAYPVARRVIDGVEREWRSILGGQRYADLRAALLALDAWRQGRMPTP